MPEKPAPSKGKEDQRMVPLAELVDFRRKARQREEELKGQLNERDARIVSLEDELKVVSADVEDDEKIKNVRSYLLTASKKLDGERAKHLKTVTEIEERERAVAVKELVAEFRSKGVDVDTETLMDEKEPRLKCMELYAAHLEGKTKEEEKTPESKIYETGAHGVIKKMPKDMDDKEFAEYEKTIKAEALSKR